MEKKYRKYIEHMLTEIEKNNDNNARLALEVNSLRDEISESKKDILIID
jgi:predicted  nucleic acid-binding Zn-ribbon protein